MNTSLSAVRQLAREYKPRVVEIRRHLHAHPELSGEERLTADFIAQQLAESNIPFSDNIGGYGVVATIKGKNPYKTHVALRADMDALNITEETGLPYASKNQGVMHACGHDFHVANLLGTAFILNELKEAFEGTVSLVFQPSEEKIPSGAERMLNDGLFGENLPKAIFALHVDPEIPAGQIGTRKGAFMAAADELFITVHGKGGHGAYPHKCVDPIVISAQIILALQTIISRNADPTNPTVVNIGRIEGLGRTNVIPDEVHLAGTIRTFDNTWRNAVHLRIMDIVTHTAKAFYATTTVEIKRGYPPLINDEALTQRSVEHLSQLFGTENIVECPLRMGAEDFAYFARQIPATLLRLGVGNEKIGAIAPLHTSRFTIDEDAFETGMTALACLALRELQ